MNRETFQARMFALGWNDSVAAKKLGRNLSDIIGYKNGSKKIPEAVEQLVERIAKDRGLT